MFNEGYLNNSEDDFNDGNSRLVLKYVKKSKLKSSLQKLETALTPLSIWYRSLKSIEKNCGCGVVSYFRFIAWLLKINIAMLVLLFSILITPYLLIKPYKFEDLSVDGQTPNVSNKFTKALNCTKNTLAADDLNYLNQFLNILQGKGPLENSPMFIGFYFNKSYFNLTSDSFTRTSFVTPIAYGVAFGLCILVSLLATLYSSGKNYKHYLVDESEFNKFFGLSLFAGYDYGITSEKRIRYLRSDLSKKIKIEFQQRKENLKRSLLSTNQVVLIYLIRVIVNTLFVGFLLLVYVAIAISQNAPLKLIKYKLVTENQVLTMLVDYIPVVVISAIGVLFPLINNWVVKFEKYRSTFAMGVCLKRVILVQATSLLIFIFTILDQIKETNISDKICHQTDKIRCWETFVGQQFYRLSLLGFVTSVIIGPILHFVRAQLYLRKVCVTVFGPVIFDLSTEGFQLISAQTECWMGLWFCPFLPLILAVKLVLLFYIRKPMFMRNFFVPSMETLSVSGGQRFFQDMLSYSLAFVMLPIGYLLSKKTPSRGCSPFRIYDNPDGTFSFSSSFRDYVLSLSITMRIIFDSLKSMYTTILTILILVVIIYVKYAQSKTQRKYLSILRNQIIQDQKDKLFYDEKAMKVDGVLKRRRAFLNKDKNK